MKKSCSSRITNLRTRPVLLLAGFSFVLAACVSLTGCSILTPAKDTARHFVLTPLPSARPAPAAPGAQAVGVGQVKLPAYLLETSLAVRTGTNEIEYLSSALWAERLDTGLQRVLAANVAALVPTDQIRLSTWRIEDVGAEVYVAVERFDVDAEGHGVLVAWWRILAPGGVKTLKSGEARLTRDGPSPAANPSAAIVTLSELVADLSRQVVSALKETVPALRPATSAQ